MLSCELPPLEKKKEEKREGTREKKTDKKSTPVACLVITSRGFLHTFVCVLCVFVRVLCVFVRVRVRVLVRLRSLSRQVGYKS